MLTDNIIKKAYKRLVERYRDKNGNIDVRILNRFYQEKHILHKCDNILLSFELICKIRERADALGEHTYLSGGHGASFIGYLLGATDVNPLPVHEYCPKCHFLKFINQKITPFDSYSSKCYCENDTIIDGWNLSFDANLSCFLYEHKIQINVSKSFYNEAASIVNGDGNGCYINLMPLPLLDRYKELEIESGVKMKDISDASTIAAPFFWKKEIDGIPMMRSGAFRRVYEAIKPMSYSAVLDAFGLEYIWLAGADECFLKGGMSVNELPAFRDELYHIIRSRLQEEGIYETGLAFEVSEKVRAGLFSRTGMDETFKSSLSVIGFNASFCSLLQNITYLFPKAHAVNYLRYAVKLMWYKINFKDIFARLFRREDLSDNIDEINQRLEEKNVFIVVDIETTGIFSPNERIIEIKAVKIQDGKEIERYHTLVNPHMVLSEEIERISGISNDSLKTAPSIETILPDFLSFIADHLLVVMRSDYLLGYLDKEMNNTGRYILNPFVDVRKLSIFQNPDLRYNTNTEIKKHFLPVDFNFNDDIRAVYEIFFKLLRNGSSNHHMNTHLCKEQALEE